MKKNGEVYTKPFYTVSRLYKRKRRNSYEQYYKWVDEERTFITEEDAEKYIDMIHETSIDIKNYTPEDRFIIQKVENIKMIIYDED